MIKQKWSYGRFPDWRNTLRERIFRLQNWYQDRTGEEECIRCGKGRKRGTTVAGSRLMCRECLTVASISAESEISIAGKVSLREKPLLGDLSPSWENAVRLLEGE